MSLHAGENNIIDIFDARNKIARVYKGSDLVWGYYPGEVIFESSTAGAYQINIKCNCKVRVDIVGAGGGGAHGLVVAGQNYYWYSSGGGGSGAYITGIKSVTAGNYTLTVGQGGNGSGVGTASTGGSSSAFGQVASGGAGGHTGWIGETDLGGVGGSYSTTLTGINGNKGAGAYNNSSGCAGGASVYEGYGAGAAANSSTPSGGNGYIKITAV